MTTYYLKSICPGGFSPTNNTLIVSFLFRLQLREDENCDRLEQNTKETESGGEDIQQEQANEETKKLMSENLEVHVKHCKLVRY